MPFGQKQRRQAGKRLQFHRVFKIIPNIAQILFGYAVFPSGKHHGLFAFGGFFECLSLFFGYLLPSQLTVHVVAVAPIKRHTVACLRRPAARYSQPVHIPSARRHLPYTCADRVPNTYSIESLINFCSKI